MATGPAVGRDATISKASTALAGVTMFNIKVANEPIDVTTADETGFITYLADAKTKQLTFDVEGIMKDGVLQDIALAPAGTMLLTDLTITLSVSTDATHDVIGGDFWMSSFEEGFPMDGGTTFKASFASSGTWTFT